MPGGAGSCTAVRCGRAEEDSLEVKVRALLAERQQRIGHEKQLAALVSSCQ